MVYAVQSWLIRQAGIRAALVIEAVGRAIAENPSLNTVLRWGRVYPRTGVNVAVPVLSDPSGEDLTAGFNRAAEIYQARAYYRTEVALYSVLPVAAM